MNTTAVILAAGSGSRMKTDKTKQKMILGGKTVLRRTLLAFEECSDISDIIVTVRADEVNFAREQICGLKKVRKIAIGGKTRLESAKNAFESIDWDCEYIAVHDGARCLITPEIIHTICNDAEKYGAATASCAITDTVKKVDADGNILETLDRNVLVSVQTPQIFKKELYARGISSADLNDSSVTDDNMLLERMGISVHCTDTGKQNIKITVPEDLFLAECLLTEN